MTTLDRNQPEAHGHKETTPFLLEESIQEAIGTEIQALVSPEQPNLAVSNKAMVETYMEAFRRNDHELILSCLTDDVVWDIPGAFHIVGKEAFDREIENEAFVGRPAITVTRMTEESDVVVAEGAVRVQRKGGDFVSLMFCDVFVMQRGKIRQLISYLVPVDGASSPA